MRRKKNNGIDEVTCPVPTDGANDSVNVNGVYDYATNTCATGGEGCRSVGHRSTTERFEAISLYE